MNQKLPAITPEIREAFKNSRGAPIQLQDPLTTKVYWMAKLPSHSSLDEKVISEGLQIALAQYARGEFDEWTDDRVIAEAARLHAGRSIEQQL